MTPCVCFDMARELSRVGNWTVEVQFTGDRRRNRPCDRTWFECVVCDARYVLIPPVRAAQLAQLTLAV